MNRMLAILLSALCAVCSLAGCARAADPGGVSAVTGSPSAFDGFAEVSKQDVVAIVDAGDAAHVGVAGQDVYIETSGGDRFWCYDADGEIRMYLKFNEIAVQELSDERIDPVHDVTSVSGGTTRTWLNFGMIPNVLLMGMVALAIAYAIKLRQGSKSGVPVTGLTEEKPREAKREDEVPKVRFRDVEGVDALKLDMERIVDSLVNPGKYREMGARPPKGVILYGPPGTGKTLLAKAIAGEAGVPFFQAVGSDFVEKYVGVGARRVRDLYAKARKAAPCIVFIDEIDAVAGRRGRDDNGERDQTVNALLSELDGFDGSSGVVTICATNRLELLDDAFRRAGRFDLKLAVGLPDVKARERILVIHARDKKLSDAVSFQGLAKRCYGFSGADLEALLNEAAMSAVGCGHSVIKPDDVDEAFFKIVMQGNKKPRESMDELGRLTAWHEAGHALATKLLTEDSVPSVTIVGSSSGAGGATFRAPRQDGLQSRRYLRSLISVMYAGRAAEEIYLKDPDGITTGARQDIKQATELIREYVAAYGMGDMGLLDVSQFGKDFGPVLDESSRMAKDVYRSTLQLLEDNRDKLARLAGALIERETLSESEVDEAIA